MIITANLILTQYVQVNLLPYIEKFTSSILTFLEKSHLR
jgi:hypothetical protein